MATRKQQQDQNLGRVGGQNEVHDEQTRTPGAVKRDVGEMGGASTQAQDEAREAVERGGGGGGRGKQIEIDHENDRVGHSPDNAGPTEPTELTKT